MTRGTLVVVGLAALVAHAPAGAQDSEWNRYTLDGLPGVYVRAEASPGCESLGMPASSIQADAAVALLESEVPVLTEEQMLAHVGLPELRITLDCVAGDEGGVPDAVAFSVAVRVQQAAKMIRDEQITLSEAVTWHTTHTGAAPRASAPDAIRSAVTAKLEEFAAAYVAANADEGGGR